MKNKYEKTYQTTWANLLAGLPQNERDQVSKYKKHVIAARWARCMMRNLTTEEKAAENLPIAETILRMDSQANKAASDAHLTSLGGVKAIEKKLELEETE